MEIFIQCWAHLYQRLEERYLGTMSDIVSVFLGTCMDLREGVKLTGF